MDKNIMLQEVRDRYFEMLNQGSPKGKKEKEKYCDKLQKLVIAAQCLVACGAVCVTGYPWETQLDIKTFWPNFLFENRLKIEELQ